MILGQTLDIVLQSGRQAIIFDDDRSLDGVHGGVVVKLLPGFFLGLVLALVHDQQQGDDHAAD